VVHAAVMAESHIQESPNSNHGQVTGYPTAFHDFPQFLQANAAKVSINRP